MVCVGKCSREMSKVNKISQVYIYAQLRQKVKEMISTGRLQPGDKSSPELELADMLGVSRNAVRKAMLALKIHQDYGML